MPSEATETLAEAWDKHEVKLREITKDCDLETEKRVVELGITAFIFAWITRGASDAE